MCLCAAAVAIVKATRSDVGRTVVGTIAGFLLVLLASPLYDVYSLHSQKEKTDSAETLLSDTRRCDTACWRQGCLLDDGVISCHAVIDEEKFAHGYIYSYKANTKPNHRRHYMSSLVLTDTLLRPIVGTALQV